MLQNSIWLFAIIAALCLSKVLSFAPRTLVVMEDDFSRQQYSRFFKSLKQRGHKLDFKTAKDKNIVLTQFGVLNYENAILLAPGADKIGESLSHKNFLDFLDHGGNILVGLTNQGSKSIDKNLELLNSKGYSSKSNTKPLISDLFYKLSEKCGITIHQQDSMVLNNMHHAGIYNINNNNNNNNNNNLNSMLTQRNLFNNDVVVNTDLNEKILFNGIGMTIPSHAHLSHSLLTGDEFTYSVLKGSESGSGGAPDKNIIASNNKLSLISSLQTRKNARITFIGSMSMLTDEYYLSKANNNEYFDNQKFINKITKYTFGERGILRATNATHYRIDDITINPNRYRINDNVHFSVSIEEFSSECDCWIPFTEDDVQFEFIRLDPFIRRFMKHDGKGTYSVDFKIPDIFGVYKFTIFYQRRGWSHLFYEELVSVRPYFHNEYERFLGSATPYYCGTWSMIAGFIVFSLVFLFGAKSGKKVF